LGDLKAEKRLLKKRKLLRVRIPRVIVKTLCDELGALANDDAERPRAAFHKAAKANHPDDTPGDPDAPHRFRRIVRAHDVLGDEPQRATYDWLLARKPQAKPPVQSATCSLPRSAASFSTPSPVLLSLVSIGTFLLCEHVFRARFHSCAREMSASSAWTAPMPDRPSDTIALATPRQELDDTAVVNKAEACDSAKEMTAPGAPPRTPTPPPQIQIPR
jgi:curved DNA-binding protein CbpA